MNWFRVQTLIKGFWKQWEAAKKQKQRDEVMELLLGLEHAMGRDMRGDLKA